MQAVLALTPHILLQVRRAGGREQGSLTLCPCCPPPNPGHCAPPSLCNFKHTSSPRDRHLLWPVPWMRWWLAADTLLRIQSLCAGTWPSREETEARSRPQQDAPAWTLASPSQDLSTDGISWKHQTLCSPFGPYSPMSTPFSSLAEPPTSIPVGLGTGAAWSRLPPPKYYHMCPQPRAPGNLVA